MSVEDNTPSPQMAAEAQVFSLNRLIGALQRLEKDFGEAEVVIGHCQYDKTVGTMPIRALEHRLHANGSRSVVLRTDQNDLLAPMKTS